MPFLNFWPFELKILLDFPTAGLADEITGADLGSLKLVIARANIVLYSVNHHLLKLIRNFFAALFAN